MIGAKEAFQFALRVMRQIDELSPIEKGEVMLMANGWIQIEVQRFLREQANVGLAAQAGFAAPQDE